MYHSSALKLKQSWRCICVRTFGCPACLEEPPEIVTFGVRGVDGTDGYVTGAKRIVTQAVENATHAELKDVTLLKERVRVELKRFIQKQTGGRPIISPVIVQL
jgi:ribonuclease J